MGPPAASCVHVLRVCALLVLPRCGACTFFLPLFSSEAQRAGDVGALCVPGWRRGRRARTRSCLSDDTPSRQRRPPPSLPRRSPSQPAQSISFFAVARKIPLTCLPPCMPPSQAPSSLCATSITTRRRNTACVTHAVHAALPRSPCRVHRRNTRPGVPPSRHEDVARRVLDTWRWVRAGVRPSPQRAIVRACVGWAAGARSGRVPGAPLYMSASSAEMGACVRRGSCSAGRDFLPAGVWPRPDLTRRRTTRAHACVAAVCCMMRGRRATRAMRAELGLAVHGVPERWQGAGDDDGCWRQRR